MKNLKVPVTIETYFKYAEFLVRKFYNIYTDIYIDSAIDLKDLYQEAKLKVVEIFNKFKKEDITYPLVKKAIEWKLNDLKLSHINKIKSHTPSQQKQCEKCFGKKKIYDIPCPFCNETGKQPPILWSKIPIDNIENLEYKSTDNLLFMAIQKLLTPKEYEIISLHIKDKFTFEEIGKKMKQERRTIFETYKRALRKLRKIYKRK